MKNNLSKYYTDKYIDAKIKEFSNSNKTLSKENIALIHLMMSYLKNTNNEKYNILRYIETNKYNNQK